MAGLAAAFGSGAMTNSIPEVEGADCIFVIGSNTLEQHPAIGARVMKAKEKGAKLIVVDPRRVPLATHADVYLQIKPGTDACMLNGLMNIILSEGLEDKEFIKERTEGFEEFKEKVAQYPPDKVEEICGINGEELHKAARLFVEAPNAMILYCMGITQHTSGCDNVKSVANLALLTGNVGREFTGVNPLRGQNNVQGACDVGALPNVFTGYQSVQDIKAREKFEQAWGAKLPEQPGLTVVEMINAACEGSLKALYIMGENPMISDPDLKHVKEGLESLDFLIVQDIFLTETAMLADVVLPAASFAEKEGTFTSTDRRVMRVRKAIEPVGQSKGDLEIISQLAQKMGAPGFAYDSAKAVMEEIASLTPSYGGISYDRLDNGEVLAWPCPSKDHPGTKFLHEKTFSRGKGQFTPVDHKDPAELPDEEFPFILTTGRVAFQYHTGSMTRRISSLAREAPTGFVEINPQDAQKLKIDQGEKVKVESRRGEIEIDALITDKIIPGTVFIPFHFAECAANQLTNSSLDPEAKIPELKVCAVSIRKVEVE